MRFCTNLAIPSRQYAVTNRQLKYQAKQAVSYFNASLNINCHYASCCRQIGVALFLRCYFYATCDEIKLKLPNE